MGRLQNSVLAADVPAAKAHAPLLACVDLESRKRMRGLSEGPGISHNALSEVCPAKRRPVRNPSLSMSYQSPGGLTCVLKYS